LFGDEDFEINPPNHPSRIARDSSEWMPGADLRFQDTKPWRLNKVVVNTPTGPQWALTDEERKEITSDEDRWNLIKNQGSMRLSMANTGNGLVKTDDSTSSPYSYGDSIFQGWVKLADNSYKDVNDASWSAGWKGWSSMWLNKCGNLFIHEVGHTLSLSHFTSGQAENWGIDDQYP
jgi:hypothetical protein